jgi:hypothetical protein
MSTGDLVPLLIFQDDPGWALFPELFWIAPMMLGHVV